MLSLSRTRIYSALLIQASGITGLALLGGPSNPDLPFLQIQLLGCFLVFVAWALGTFFWGRLLARALDVSDLGAMAEMVLGVVWAAALAFAAGYLGWVGYGQPLLALALLSLGGFLGADSKTVLSRWEPVTRQAAWWIPVGLLLLGWVIKATLLHGTSDPHQYHLMGPRLWSEAGGEYFTRGHIIVYQCWWWEYLYVWGNVLMGGASGGGLVESQLFAQWVHVVFGAGTAALALSQGMRRLGFESSWSAAAVMAALALPGAHREIAWLAKNDWGVMACAVAGWVALLGPAQARTRGHLLFSGIALGFALASKPNSLYWIACASPWVLLTSGRDPLRPARWVRDAFLLAIVALGVMAPILLRNWARTGQAFFPFSGLTALDAPVSPQLQLTALIQKPRLNLDPDHLREVFSQVMADAPGFVVSMVALPVLALFKRKSRRSWLLFALGLWVSCGWYFFMEISNPFVRWLGVPLLLAPSALVLSIRGRGRFRSVLPILILAALTGVFLSARPWSGLVPFHSRSASLRSETVHLGARSKAWLRSKVSPVELIVSLGDNQLYLLSSLRAFSIVDDARIGRLTYDIHDGTQVVALLNQAGFRYAYDSVHWSGDDWTLEGLLIRGLIAAHPEALAFASQDSFVVDLDRLRDETARACVFRESFAIGP